LRASICTRHTAASKKRAFKIQVNYKYTGGVMFNLKRNLIKLGTLSISIALLAACHTVKGTVTGAKQDIKATGKAISRTMQ
ncbi:hypothetical protein, partial [Legionella pneumophila]|uniref:hypothetical protein n=1 Tax=Legionella pneumophila TaxID=446 RepID=UPI001E4CF162